MATRQILSKRVPFTLTIAAFSLAGLLAAAGCGGGGTQATTPNPNPNPNPEPPDIPAPSLEEQLLRALSNNDMRTPLPAAAQDPAQVELGRMLFFDKALSSRFDISCAGCHHPDLVTGDGIPLSIGTGHDGGLGPERLMGPGREFVARNATELWNRGMPEWTTMLWDARVESDGAGGISSPAGSDLPEGLSGVLAAQALFALADSREMHESFSFFGGPPHGGDPATPPPPPPFQEETQTQIWQQLVSQITVFNGYQTLFESAYPSTPLGEVNIAHLANALAAFQTEAFVSLNSPFDRYLKGDSYALTEQQKRGALLFYTDAACASCHAGALMTDQETYNILVPVIGPGQEATPGDDRGRGLSTGAESDDYAFRTPPLRNVGTSGPYMHNGTFNSLEEVIQHHIDPVSSFRNYDAAQLPLDLRSTVRNDEGMLATMSDTVTDKLDQIPDLTDDQIAELVAFLDSLNDPTISDTLKGLEPDNVPSFVSPGYGGGSGGGPNPGTGGGGPNRG